MKKILSVAVSFLMMLTICFYQHRCRALSHDTSLLYRKIVIDPGHGGLDNGASCFGYNEDDINLQISKELKKCLEDHGAKVNLTRSDDHDMTNRNHHYSKQDDMYLRVKKIDSFKANYLISIHLNYSPTSSWGSQVFYYYRSKQAMDFAKSIHNQMVKVTHSSKPISGCSFRVLRATQTVGVLIECGFMSNANEGGQLRSAQYQKKLAESIYLGVKNYDKKLKKTNKKVLTKA